MQRGHLWWVHLANCVPRWSQHLPAPSPRNNCTKYPLDYKCSASKNSILWRLNGLLLLYLITVFGGKPVPGRILYSTLSHETSHRDGTSSWKGCKVHNIWRGRKRWHDICSLLCQHVHMGQMACQWLDCIYSKICWKYCSLLLNSGPNNECVGKLCFGYLLSVDYFCIKNSHKTKNGLAKQSSPQCTQFPLLQGKDKQKSQLNMAHSILILWDISGRCSETWVIRAR